MKLIDRVNEDGRGIIVMVPEISLTPQMVSTFKGRYGENVAVFHSGLSMGERMDEWKRVKSGKARIAIGTRSAVFAPFDDIGLIIIDEEQEHTYKSENSIEFEEEMNEENSELSENNQIEKEDIDKYFTSVFKVINVVSTIFLKEYFNKRNIVVANYYFNNAVTEISDCLDDKNKLQ